MLSKEKEIRKILQCFLCMCVLGASGLMSVFEIDGGEQPGFSVCKYQNDQKAKTTKIVISEMEYTEHEYDAYINSNAVPIKNAADDESTIMYISDYADKVRVIGDDKGESYGWSRVDIDGHIGYVKSCYLSAEELQYEPYYDIDVKELYFNEHYDEEIRKKESVIGADLYNSDLADIVVYRAYSLIGVPYGHGYTETLTDCVGLTQMCYGEAGISLPWSLEQKEYGTSVPYEDARKGDLLIWSPLNENRVSHVGIYVGNGKMIHASCSKGVTETSVSHYVKYGGNLVDVRRIV